MSDTKEAGTAPATAETPKKVFTRDQVKRSVPVSVHLPRLYPDYHWDFQLRLKLSKEADTRRNEYLALSASDQQSKANEQNLDELCDLIETMPKGFGDLQDNGQGPGSSFKSYVQSTPDAHAKDLLYKIVEGAINLYWATLMPREFRSEI